MDKTNAEKVKELEEAVMTMRTQMSHLSRENRLFEEELLRIKSAMVILLGGEWNE
jgi:hypothetical protein